MQGKPLLAATGATATAVPSHLHAAQQPEATRSSPDCTPFDQYSASLLQGHWEFDAARVTHPASNRTFTVGPPACPLRRFTHADAVQCLANRHVLFVGDSVLGYQFMTLVAWLETGMPVNAFGPREPSNMQMRMFFDGNGCGGRIRCDLYRNESDMRTLMDNRYYFNEALNLTLSRFGFYAAAYGHAPVGWAPSNVPFSKDYLWNNISMAELARVAHEHLGAVDELLLSVGVWGVPQFNSTTEAARAQLAPWSLLMRARDKLPIWSTPTLQVDRPELLLPRSAAELGPGYAAAQLLRWRIIDRNGMVRTLHDALHNAGQHNPLLQWTDRTHFQPYVNIEFNNVLLNMIC